MGHDCKFCSGGGGARHALACPDHPQMEDPKTAASLWRAGYKDGKKCSEPYSSDPTYMLGYVRGEAAADDVDEVENG